MLTIQNTKDQGTSQAFHWDFISNLSISWPRYLQKCIVYFKKQDIQPKNDFGLFCFSFFDCFRYNLKDLSKFPKETAQLETWSWAKKCGTNTLSNSEIEWLFNENKPSFLHLGLYKMQLLEQNPANLDLSLF